MSAADRFAQFEQFEDAPALVDTLDDYRRVGERGGAARLLRDLVKQGLAENAIPAAAVLVVALDRGAA